jgi:hypothetical protein
MTSSVAVENGSIYRVVAAGSAVVAGVLDDKFPLSGSNPWN